MKFVKDEVRKNCHDCAAKPCEHHRSGCDTERCPKCGGQLISCDCFRSGDGEFDENEFAKYEQEKWSGIMYEDAKLFAEQNGLFTYFDHGWIKCDSTHPNATHDINTAMMKMPEFVPKLKQTTIPELTKQAATDFFAELFYGEHHIPSEVKRCGSGWSVNSMRSDLATTDFNNLTRFVLMCHEYCIRGELTAVRNTVMKIIIHPRKRGGGITSNHPTIEEAINKHKEFKKDKIKN